MEALRLELEESEVARKIVLPGFRIRISTLEWRCSTATKGNLFLDPGQAYLIVTRTGSFVLRSGHDHIVRVCPSGHVMGVRGPAAFSGVFGEGKHQWLVAQWGLGVGPSLPLSLVAHPVRQEFEGVDHRLQDALLREGDAAEGMALSAIQEAAVLIQDAKSTFAIAPRGPVDDPDIDAAAIAVRQDPAQPWKLIAGADIAGYSESHFSKLFHDYWGMGFREYVESCRLERAVALLHATELPVDLVADTAGFPNTPGMRQAFKRTLGLSPSDLRWTGV